MIRQTTAPTLPFTITPHHICGYDVKIWFIIDALLLAGSAVLFFSLDALQPYWYLWLVLVAGFVMSHTLFFIISRGYALTITNEGVEVKTPQQTVFVPFDQLEPVHRGVAYVPPRAFRSMPIVSKSLNVSFAPNTLNWGVKDFNRFYAALPSQLQDTTDAKW